MVWWSTGMENSYIPKSIRTPKKKKKMLGKGSSFSEQLIPWVASV